MNESLWRDLSVDLYPYLSLSKPRDKRQPAHFVYFLPLKVFFPFRTAKIKVISWFFFGFFFKVLKFEFFVNKIVGALAG